MATIDRQERLLALILLAQTKGATQKEKVAQLNLAGFSNVEIADLLNMTAAGVSQSLYEAKKSRPKKPATRGKTTPKTD
jgi:predicted transcriptional regulator